MITKEKAEEFARNLRGLGYVKINVGEWEQTVKDTGSGFPVTVYTCPFCSYTTTDNTPYCPICGAKVGSTAQVIKDTDNGVGTTRYSSPEDMWEDLAERKEE